MLNKNALNIRMRAKKEASNTNYSLLPVLLLISYFNVQLGGKNMMHQKHLLEKWIRQIESGEINPEGMGLGSDKQKAIIKLKNQITQLNSPNKKLK